MASLSLPPLQKPVPSVPSRPSAKTSAAAKTAAAPSASAKKARPPPPSYEERCRAAAALTKLSAAERQRRPPLFVPRSLADFADGGAYPEIHVAQYPRHLGNPHIKAKANASGTGGGTGSGGASTSQALVNVEVDKDGQISYDAIVKGGTNRDKIVYSQHDDVKELRQNVDPDDIAPATAEEEQAEADRVNNALQAMMGEKALLAKPKGSALLAAQSNQEQSQFVQYTPRPDAPGYNPAAAQRVIQMVPAQTDPLMPPKHKHLKAPPGPAEDPVPVLHAPPTKLTKEERQAWNIPACISNWKNVRGYTIPLDKRLAADGRGLVEHSISNNFATLSESLYVAEQQARQEVKLRAQVSSKQALQEKQAREEELRQMAQQARMQRSGGGGALAAVSTVDSSSDEDDEEDDKKPVASGTGERIDRVPSDDESDDEEDNDDQVAARQRERLRQERKREREKDLRMENNMQAKKKRLEEDRDISEKIALGVHTGTGGGGLAGEVDARLYNQSAGMDSGFGADDEYNTYSQPMFNRQGVSSSSIYRPTRGETEYNADEQYDKLVKGATTKFQPDKGFAGAEGGVSQSGGGRSAPVQFEKGK